MARIRYDRCLKDVDELIVISNTDSERAVDVTSESFENPAIKFRILETTGGEDLLAAFDVSDSSTSVAVYNELRDCAPQLISGQLPGWRLVGINFSPTCLMMYYVNPRVTGEEVCGDIRYDDAAVYCISCDDNWSIAMEFEVDYADGLPSRRYIAKMVYIGGPLENGQLHVVIDEYYGKRKIRRLEFTEGETAAPEQLQLCHITEY